MVQCLAIMHTIIGSRSILSEFQSIALPTITGYCSENGVKYGHIAALSPVIVVRMGLNMVT